MSGVTTDTQERLKCTHKLPNTEAIRIATPAASRPAMGSRAADLLQRELPAAVLRRAVAYGEETVWTGREHIVEACRLLRGRAID